LPTNIKKQLYLYLKDFSECGFSFIATSGTQKKLTEEGLFARVASKIGESDFDLLDEIKSGNVHMVINTITKGKNVESDGFSHEKNLCGKWHYLFNQPRHSRSPFKKY
jgi:carbamoyl-phosphate synthase large subunit